MEHFLGDDFRRRFHAYALAIDRPFLPGVIEKIGSCDEIHLAFLELQLDPCAGIFAVVAGKARGHIAQAGSDEAQVLGFGTKMSMSLLSRCRCRNISTVPPPNVQNGSVMPPWRRISR
jgi:hypothetical protein